MSFIAERFSCCPAVFPGPLHSEWIERIEYRETLARLGQAWDEISFILGLTQEIERMKECHHDNILP